MVVDWFLQTLHDTFGLAANQTAMQASDTDSDSGVMRALWKAAIVGVIPSIDDECSSKDDDGSSDDGVNDSDVDPSHFGGYSGEGDECASAEAPSQWSPSSEERLLAYRRQKRPWKWILRRFPHRTEGAVRTCWHMPSSEPDSPRIF